MNGYSFYRSVKRYIPRAVLRPLISVAEKVGVTAALFDAAQQSYTHIETKPVRLWWIYLRSIMHSRRVRSVSGQRIALYIYSHAKEAHTAEHAGVMNTLRWMRHTSLIILTDCEVCVQSVSPHYRCVHMQDVRMASLQQQIRELSIDVLISQPFEETLLPDMLTEYIQRLSTSPETQMVYADRVYTNETHTETFVAYYPPFSELYLWQYPYIPPVFAVRASTILALPQDTPTDQTTFPIDIVSHVIPSAVRHIPRIGSITTASRTKSPQQIALQQQAVERWVARQNPHMALQVTNGLASDTFRVHFPTQQDARVSIIIPTKDNGDVLRRCIESIEHHTTQQAYELIIINNQSSDAETLAYLKTLAKTHTVIDDPRPFNYAVMNTEAAQKATGDYILFLNDDMEVLEDDWLTSMVSLCAFSDIGIVGAQLVYPNGAIQHAGLAIDASGTEPVHSWHKYVQSKTASGSLEPGYMHSLVVVREVSAVTGACLLIRRALWNELTGFDPQLPIGYNDIDLCFRARTAGYRVLYNPYSRLVHHESLSRNTSHITQVKHHYTDSAYFMKKWKTVLHENDPYTHPDLKLRLR